MRTLESSTSPMEQFLVVGDRFAGFCTRPNVFTVSQFATRLRKGDLVTNGGRYRARFGQGVSAYEEALISAVVSRSPGRDQLDVVPLTAPDLVPRHLAHKCNDVNVLIEHLRLDDDGRTYVADLRIHNNNELLLDHQTGQHVQGMVVVEAVRQMFLAVCEKYLTVSRQDVHYYHVIDQLNTTFRNFLFPLPAVLRFTVLSMTEDKPGRERFQVVCRIEQGGTVCAESEVTFTAFDDRLITPKETQCADRALANLLGLMATDAVATADTAGATS